MFWTSILLKVEHCGLRFNADYGMSTFKHHYKKRTVLKTHLSTETGSGRPPSTLLGYKSGTIMDGWMLFLCFFSIHIAVFHVSTRCHQTLLPTSPDCPTWFCTPVFIHPDCSARAVLTSAFHYLVSPADMKPAHTCSVAACFWVCALVLTSGTRLTALYTQQQRDKTTVMWKSLGPDAAQKHWERLMSY